MQPTIQELQLQNSVLPFCITVLDRIQYANSVRIAEMAPGEEIAEREWFVAMFDPIIHSKCYPFVLFVLKLFFNSKNTFLIAE